MVAVKVSKGMVVIKAGTLSIKESLVDLHGAALNTGRTLLFP